MAEFQSTPYLKVRDPIVGTSIRIRFIQLPIANYGDWHFNFCNFAVEDAKVIGGEWESRGPSQLFFSTFVSLLRKTLNYLQFKDFLKLESELYLKQPLTALTACQRNWPGQLSPSLETKCLSILLWEWLKMKHTSCWSIPFNTSLSKSCVYYKTTHGETVIWREQMQTCRSIICPPLWS